MPCQDKNGWMSSQRRYLGPWATGQRGTRSDSQGRWSVLAPPPPRRKIWGEGGGHVSEGDDASYGPTRAPVTRAGRWGACCLRTDRRTRLRPSRDPTQGRNAGRLGHRRGLLPEPVTCLSSRAQVVPVATHPNPQLEPRAKPGEPGLPSRGRLGEGRKGPWNSTRLGPQRPAKPDGNCLVSVSSCRLGRAKRWPPWASGTLSPMSGLESRVPRGAPRIPAGPWFGGLARPLPCEAGAPGVAGALHWRLEAGRGSRSRSRGAREPGTWHRAALGRGQGASVGNSFS